MRKYLLAAMDTVDEHGLDEMDNRILSRKNSVS